MSASEFLEMVSDYDGIEPLVDSMPSPTPEIISARLWRNRSIFAKDNSVRIAVAASVTAAIAVSAVVVGECGTLAWPVESDRERCNAMMKVGLCRIACRSVPQGECRVLSSCGRTAYAEAEETMNSNLH